MTDNATPPIGGQAYFDGENWHIPTTQGENPPEEPPVKFSIEYKPSYKASHFGDSMGLSGTGGSQAVMICQNCGAVVIPENIYGFRGLKDENLRHRLHDYWHEQTISLGKSVTLLAHGAMSQNDVLNVMIRIIKEMNGT